MIAILLASLAVASGGLQMSIGSGANPHMRPRGWNGQRTDAPQRLGITNARSVRPEIAKAFAAALALDAGLVIADVPQSGGAGRGNRIANQVGLAGARGPVKETARFANGTTACPQCFHGMPHPYRVQIRVSLLPTSESSPPNSFWGKRESK